jgi:hypothetical protein
MSRNESKCVDTVSENKDLMTSRSESSTVPHARMIDNGTKFDVSPYCKVGLIDSVSRLTSVSWAAKTILRPAGKIMWRSLFLDDATGNVQALFTALSNNEPITDVPFKRKSAGSATSGFVPNDLDTTKRSWPNRIVHFVFIGIPLAILVGLVYGLLNFVQGVMQNIITVLHTGQKLFEQARDDMAYYKSHPDELPPRDKAIEAVSVQVVSPYVARFVGEKIPFVGKYVAGPFERFFGQVAAKRVNQLYDMVDRKRKGPAPSAPPLPARG